MRNEKIGAKIREAQLDKIPVMLVVGDREASAAQVAVRLRTRGNCGTAALEEFLGQALGWAESRALQIDWSAPSGDAHS